MSVAMRKSKPEKLMLHVVKGGFAPADNFVVEKLRARGYKTGDIVAAVLTKPRNPGFHRLAHRIGELCAANIDAFHGMDAHTVLKRLQWESGIGCDEMGVRVPGVGLAMIRIPRSLSYESMDDGSFHEIMRGLCRWIAAEYWPGLTAEQIEEMAESFVAES